MNKIVVKLIFKKALSVLTYFIAAGIVLFTSFYLFYSILIGNVQRFPTLDSFGGIVYFTISIIIPQILLYTYFGKEILGIKGKGSMKKKLLLVIIVLLIIYLLQRCVILPDGQKCLCQGLKIGEYCLGLKIHLFID